MTNDTQDTKAFARRMSEYRNMQLGEMLKLIGYKRAEITRDTYLYIDTDGKLCAVEKPDVESQPADLFEAIGYIRAWDGGVAYARADLSEVLTAGEATEIYGLASATVRQAINRGNIAARKSGGTWLIRHVDAEELWGD